MKTFDVGAALDEGQWGGYQKLLVFATALTIILDGLDNQVLAAGDSAADEGVGRCREAAFAYVLTSGMVGMMIGGFIGGSVGDRLGRRVALLGSVVFFGLLTIIVSFSTGVDHADRAALPGRARARRRDAERRGAVVRVRAAAAASVRRHADDRLHPARRIARRLRRRHDPADAWAGARCS